MDRNYINIITDLSRLFGIWRLALLAVIFRTSGVFQRLLTLLFPFFSSKILWFVKKSLYLHPTNHFRI